MSRWHTSRAGRGVGGPAIRGLYLYLMEVGLRAVSRPFHEAAIPEIADFNVLIACQRRGIGTALMDEAERRIATVSPIAGIGVGLTADYGAAQALYAKRGYVPDGRGLFHSGRPISRGATVTVDDDLNLFLIRRVRS